MDPLSITAAAVGIAAPTVHCVHLLLEDLQNIVDAPAAIERLKAQLLSVDHALASLQAVTAEQWTYLGDAVLQQSEAAMSACKDACDKFRNKLGRWTRHSDNGELSLQDRVMLGVFKQKHIELMSTQLQQYSITLVSVASIATLHGFLKQNQLGPATVANVSAKEADIATSIATAEDTLAAVDTQLGELCLAGTGENETETDRVDAITQASATRVALGTSRTLLEELLSRAQAAVLTASQKNGMTVNHFTGQNNGMQIGSNYGAISNITFGKK